MYNTNEHKRTGFGLLASAHCDAILLQLQSNKYDTIAA